MSFNFGRRKFTTPRAKPGKQDLPPRALQHNKPALTARARKIKITLPHSGMKTNNDRKMT